MLGVLENAVEDEQTQVKWFSGKQNDRQERLAVTSQPNRYLLEPFGLTVSQNENSVNFRVGLVHVHLGKIVECAWSPAPVTTGRKPAIRR